MFRGIARAPSAFGRHAQSLRWFRGTHAAQAPSVAPKWAKSTLATTGGTVARTPVFGRSGEQLHVEITQSAVDKLKAIRAEKAPPNEALRVKVESGGCHGFQFLFSLQQLGDAQPEDGVFERDGCTVLVDRRSLQVLQNCSVDYTTELIGSQFKVTSPRAKSACGCGTSFSLDVEQ